MSIAERVGEMAVEYGISGDESDRARFLAKAFSRLEGIEGDETLDLIAELVTADVLPREEGYRLAGRHSAERHADTDDARSTSWDPFGDNAERGILRNAFGTHDLRGLEDYDFVSLQVNMPRALEFLAEESELTVASWLRVHGILFGDVYPWAGTIRHLHVVKGPVRFNSHDLVENWSNTIFEKARQPGFLAANLGYIYGELAFNHPFLDGNGRSLNTVFSEMCRRAGVDIAWGEVDRDRYLWHLTQSIVLTEYEGLNEYLGSLVVPLEPERAREARLAVRT